RHTIFSRDWSSDVCSSDLFQPEAAPFRLMTPDQMARALAPLGVDRLYLLPFDREMAGMTDEEFARRVLSEGLGIVHAAVGFDFKIGRASCRERGELPAVAG